MRLSCNGNLMMHVGLSVCPVPLQEKQPINEYECLAFVIKSKSIDNYTGFSLSVLHFFCNFVRSNRKIVVIKVNYLS